MVFDAAHRIHTPVAWALISGKTRECYWQVFNWLTSSVQEHDPSYVGVDFKLAFFSNVAIHFPDAILIGCLFHFKQAIRRKLTILKFPDEEISFAMKKGVIDLITIIPKEHLNLGIGFIGEMMT